MLFLLFIAISLLLSYQRELSINLNQTQLDSWEYINGTFCNPIVDDLFVEPGVCETSFIVSINMLSKQIVRNPSPSSINLPIPNEHNIVFVDNQDIFKFCMNITIDLVAFPSEEIIDTWEFICLNYRDKGVSWLSDYYGAYGKAKLKSAKIMMDCQGSTTGFNCAFNCTPPNFDTYCDDFGNIRCKELNLQPPDCRERVDPCLYVNCQNGGVCHPHGDVFRCECPIGYGGLLCQQEICTTANCINGVCNTALECVCNPGFGNPSTGCTQISCIGVTHCGNFGKCYIDETSNTRFCVCNDEFTLGDTCQFRCRNGCVNGVCVMNENGRSAICNCSEGWEGSTCDKRILTYEDDRAKVNLINILVPLAILALSGIIFGIVVGVKRTKIN